MRIAIITESFPPDVNGVANCVVRVAENLIRKGHHPLVIAPGSARATPAMFGRGEWEGRLERVPSIALPGYPTFRLGLPAPRIRRAIAAHGADVVHLASPVALGAWGVHVARAMDLPAVASASRPPAATSGCAPNWRPEHGRPVAARRGSGASSGVIPSNSSHSGLNVP
jgi:phosphatidylinositol alpha 1,6-mannosyltransferase